VVFLERSTAAEEADDEADDSEGDDKQSCTVHVISEEREVVFERCLQNCASDNEYQTDNLRIRTSLVISDNE